MKRALWTLAVLLSHWRRHPMQLATLLIGLISATALWSGVQALNQQARNSYDRAAAMFGGTRTAMLVAKDGTASDRTFNCPSPIVNVLFPSAPDPLTSSVPPLIVVLVRFNVEPASIVTAPAAALLMLTSLSVLATLPVTCTFPEFANVLLVMLVPLSVAPLMAWDVRVSICSTPAGLVAAPLRSAVTPPLSDGAAG